ncbi:MAG: hypothetical protein COW13_04650 [Candidatus Omnitrophica bacterium CG12_big_fil_rev_8_21_14_0_65_50_5]|nr:MAG: hypothetical protein COW13_04650 [Candidatus Omnitrophica bacterium CG12_big_fil_rev_8_21_14_0_65_50_5]
MLLIIRAKIDPEFRKKVAEDLQGYVKVVVDVRRQILTAGGQKHVDGEQLHDVRMDADWAESMLTWANILTHRASLA